MTKNENQVNETRTEILSLLRSGPVDLQFKKLDDSLRNMRATLDYNLIPEDARPKSDEAKDETLDQSESKALRVYDLEVEGWRSFRVDRLVEYRKGA